VIETRLARVTDSLEISRVQRAGWVHRGIHLLDDLSEEDLAATWAEAIQQQAIQGRIVVTTSDAIVVGYCVIESSDDSSLAYVTALEVSPSHRKMGIASRLINVVADIARRMGAHELQTWVGDTEIEAIGFLKSAGWASTGAFRSVSDEKGHMFRDEVQLLTKLK
jgi:ribosomal protein S18 acetylase RimI-like enzyme